jgi:predicted transglutaminase-like cysteine proteinase
MASAGQADHAAYWLSIGIAALFLGLLIKHTTPKFDLPKAANATVTTHFEDTARRQTPNFRLVSVDPTGTTIYPSPRVTSPWSGEPFGRRALPAADGALWSKWHAAEAAIMAEVQILTRCRVAYEECPAAARALLEVINRATEKQGIARVGELNRAINLSIRPTSDRAQFAAADIWTSPLTTLASGRGDCEDYVLAKYLALREAGFALRDLRLVIVRDTMAKEDHAVLAVRLDERWVVLDNRHHMLVDSSELEHFTPLFALDHEGVRRFMPVVAERNAQHSVGEPVPARTDAVSFVRGPHQEPGAASR